MGAIYLRRDGAWQAVAGLHVRGASGGWTSARGVFVYRQNPRMNAADPVTFGWHFVKALAPPVETVQAAAAEGPAEEVIDPRTPVNVRVSWAPQGSETFAGYSVTAELKYADGPNAGATLRAATASPQAGHVDIAVVSQPADVYADVYYVNEAGSGPRVQTNTTRIG
jgi:hypothetical protein